MSTDTGGTARETPYADYLRSVVAPLLGSPETMGIEQSLDEQGVLLSLSLSDEDMGKVIGREGETARAIRLILRAYGMKNGARISMKILEPEKV